MNGQECPPRAFGGLGQLAVKSLVSASTRSEDDVIDGDVGSQAIHWCRVEENGAGVGEECALSADGSTPEAMTAPIQGVPCFIHIRMASAAVRMKVRLPPHACGRVDACRRRR